MKKRFAFFVRLIASLFLFSSACCSTLYAAFPTVQAVPETMNVFQNNATTTYELIGAATTSIKGSSKERKENIILGLKRINGKVVDPRQEFSLLAALRPFSKEAGFKEEHVISTSSSPMELGGGLCQVSTTLFRAVLASGLSVTKRQAHSYVVGYYGAGLDATVYFPGTDLRFLNNYASPVIIKSRLVGNNAEVAFYGKKDGRVSQISPIEITKVYPKPKPKTLYSTEIALGEKKCTETARKGMNTTVTYTVTARDGISTSTTFYSYYRPWAEVCYIGTTEEQKQKLEEQLSMR